MITSQSKQYSSLNASSHGPLLTQGPVNNKTTKGTKSTKGSKGNKNINRIKSNKILKNNKPPLLPKGDKKLKRTTSAKSIEQQLNIITQKYSIGKTIGRGVDSVVKVCKIKKDWLNKNIINNNNNNNNQDTINITNKNNSAANGVSITIDSVHNINTDNNDQMSRLRAMKIIDKTKIPKQTMNDICNEMNILKILSKESNDNVVKCHECYETNNRVYIVTELLSGETLEHRIISSYNYGCKVTQELKFLSEIEAANIFYQVLVALEGLHKLNIVHRDVKPENFVFSSGNINESGDKKLKLIDFGLSTTVTKHNDYELSRLCGTPLFVAPEMIQKQIYDTKVDMWAAGLILYFLLCGYLPFKLRSNDKLSVLYKQILKGNVPMLSPQWYTRSIYAKDLIRKLLVRDPTRRYSASQALQHPWFRKTFAKQNKNE